jgi:hypothetical protein
MVPLGTNTAASLPVISAILTSSWLTVGSSVVAHLGARHGVAHPGGGTGHCVGAQIDESHRRQRSRALLSTKRPARACDTLGLVGISKAPLLAAPRRRRRAFSAFAGALFTVLWSSGALSDPPPRGEAPASKPRQELPSPKAPASPSSKLRGAESIAPLVDDGSMQRSVAVVTGTVGFAGIMVGGVFGILAIARWDQVKESLGSCRDPMKYDGCPAELKESQLVASSYATVSTYSILTGTAAIVGAMVMWYMSPRLPPSTSRIKLVPVVSPGGAAGVLTGVF